MATLFYRGRILPNSQARLRNGMESGYPVSLVPVLDFRALAVVMCSPRGPRCRGPYFTSTAAILKVVLERTNL